MESISLRRGGKSPVLHLKTRYNVGTGEYAVVGLGSVDWQPVWENMPEFLEPWIVLDEVLEREGIEVDPSDDKRHDKLRDDFDEFRANSTTFSASWDAAMDKFAEAAAKFVEENKGETVDYVGRQVDSLDHWYVAVTGDMNMALQVVALGFVKTLKEGDTPTT
ncbi:MULTISPECIES: hypothetical protein [Mycobacteriaceae]|uniref:hypothetical protein n=1 Tax=Mycobacteroides abscessus TaxID=36809 RepID=UPI00025882A7|nr:hypothetical protein [Mycobacteroides abscessus]EIC62264.1 hypothetical protein S7W_24066 [Mycobacteroides abscessus M94]SKZ51101.1 Uncharacterised protein [Mycobacteroides abscessus subsp. abscessus]